MMQPSTKQQQLMSNAMWSSNGLEVYDTARLRAVPELDISAQQPEEWSMLQLHWREKHIKNDDDREQWLFDKFRRLPGGHTMIHPHTRETRIHLHQVLSEKLYSEWRPGRRLQWCVGCCGTTQRCIPTTKERMWWVILFVYGSIWVSFGYGIVQARFPDDGSDPITWDSAMAKFVNTIYMTLAWSFVALFIYEGPRLYRHCFKCRLQPRRREAQIELAKSKDRALCTCGPIICCLGTYFSRLRRARLEKCTAYDQTLDPEAATSSYIYDSDLDDPDEFIYDQHLKHAVPARSKAAFKKPKSTVYIVNVDDPETPTPTTNKNDTSRYRYDSDGSSTDMDGS